MLRGYKIHPCSLSVSKPLTGANTPHKAHLWAAGAQALHPRSRGLAGGGLGGSRGSVCHQADGWAGGFGGAGGHVARPVSPTPSIAASLAGEGFPHPACKLWRCIEAAADAWQVVKFRQCLQLPVDATAPASAHRVQLCGWSSAAVVLLLLAGGGQSPCLG